MRDRHAIGGAGLGTLQEVAEAVVLESGAAGLVGELGQAADIVGQGARAAVVFEDGGGATRVRRLGEPVQGVVGVRGGLAAGVGAGGEVAGGVIGGIGHPGIGALLGCGVAQAVDGVGRHQAARVGDLGHAVLAVVVEYRHRGGSA